jgi:hypothetical protein
MRTILQWLKERFRSFDYLPEYFHAVRLHFLDVTWGIGVGAAVPYMIYGLYSLFKTPPPLVNWLALVGAVFLAGYYLWRADHTRLLPQLEVATTAHLQETPVEQSGERRIFVQIEPQCVTDSPVTECLGHLLRVYHCWKEGEWDLTNLHERLLLGWSHYGSVPVTLYPSGGQYLNICWRPDHLRMIIPCCDPLPSRWREVFDSVGNFRFDIEITAKDCLPVQVSVIVNIDETEWNRPKVMIIPVEKERRRAILPTNLKLRNSMQS